MRAGVTDDQRMPWPRERLSRRVTDAARFTRSEGLERPGSGDVETDTCGRVATAEWPGQAHS